LGITAYIPNGSGGKGMALEELGKPRFQKQGEKKRVTS
jgi:hypothetical protein